MPNSEKKTNKSQLFKSNVKKNNKARQEEIKSMSIKDQVEIMYLGKKASQTMLKGLSKAVQAKSQSKEEQLLALQEMYKKLDDLCS